MNQINFRKFMSMYTPPHLSNRQTVFLYLAKLGQTFCLFSVLCLTSFSVYADPSSTSTLKKAPPVPPPSSAHQQSEEKGIPYPFLWSIQYKEGPLSYLFGTIHIPDSRFPHLHPLLNQAIQEVDEIYAELDFNEKAQMMISVMQKAQLPSGQSLQSILEPKLYKRLNEYFAKHKISLQSFFFFKPQFVEMIVSSLDILPLIQAGHPTLDEIVLQRGQQAKKKTGGIETLEEQLNLLFIPTQKEAIHSLEHTLGYLEKQDLKGISLLAQMRKAYFSGQSSSILKLLLKELDKSTPSQKRILDRILYGRNKIMADRIRDKMSQTPTKQFLFAFGTAHFLGEKSIIDLLTSEQFKIKRLTPPPKP